MLGLSGSSGPLKIATHFKREKKPDDVDGFKSGNVVGSIFAPRIFGYLM